MSTPRDRLQPALLDRLADDARRSSREADDAQVMTRAQLREAVLRDLSWLLNSVQPLGEGAHAGAHAAASVLGYGLPPLSGKQASRVDVFQLARLIKQTILRFEPRVLAESLEVRALETPALEAHNVIEFEIHGFLWSQPMPLELLLRTQFDLEAGKVELRDAGSAPPARTQ
jgi:type VI secretion system protein ImpF